MQIHRYTERALGEQNGIVHTSTAGAITAKKKRSHTATVNMQKVTIS